MTAPPAIVVQRVSVRAFRNLSAVEIEPSARLNVISGDNGQGKTSLLEALYFVATSRSFRTEQHAELLQEGQSICSVRARIREGLERREQRVALSGSRRSLAIDGKRPTTHASYAIRTPVVAFHPADLLLVAGPASERRRLLDRLGLFIEPSSVEARVRYGRALRERQRVLEQRGPAAKDLDAFEAIAAEEGVRVAKVRAHAATRLIEALAPAFQSVAAPDLRLEARYRAGGTDDPAQFRTELAQRRQKDMYRKSATFGPQRDELELFTDGRSARQHASQGQQRILTLALKAAELEVVRECRGAHPVLLLDDVSSELDPGRTGAVYEFLRQSQSQIFVTTTRPELFTTPSLEPGDRADYELVSGVVEVLS